MDSHGADQLNVPPDRARSLLNEARQRARGMIEDGAALRDILAVLTSAGEAISNGRTVCSVLVLDKDGLLRNGASPNLPADYLDAIDRLKPDPNLGTCAAAAATGEIVTTPNFYNDERWAELRHWPLVLGFFGAWSMPIKASDGKVLGTFGTYFREHRLPTGAERAAIGELASAAAAAIVSRAAAAN
jgi:GAF domain-containing protein